MCFITNSFIATAKYEMGSLGYRPKTKEDLSLASLNNVVCDSLFRLKDIGNRLSIFDVYYPYHWISKHINKISKAMSSERWKSSGIPYSRCEVIRTSDLYDNLIVVTNIFSRSFHSIYLEKDNIKCEKIKKEKIVESRFKTVNDKETDTIYVYEREYLKLIRRKRYADEDESVAQLISHCVDFNNGKGIVYIVFNKKADNNSVGEVINFAINEIEKMISARVAQRNLINLNIITNNMMIMNMRNMNKF